ncbi:unnamed protein product [Rotaria socialis]|uniref:Uncharacterized protein n=2 Tax=Rotaria socialis TaxID=392032 RepID=A0A821LTN7_9BILA|nr:unnamed protein product [Rotaria socialis]CAF4756744.1 unnamed protein product [Rotaria socialis]
MCHYQRSPTLSTCKYEALRSVLTELISHNERLREVDEKLNSQLTMINIYIQQFYGENQQLHLEIRKLNIDNKTLHIEKEEIDFQNQQLAGELEQVRQEH